MATQDHAGFFEEVRLTDGTNPLGDLATRPAWVANPATAITLQTSTLFNTGTTTGTISTGLGVYNQAVVLINTTAIAGTPTGNIYLQVSPDAGTTWIDYVASINITATGTQWFQLGGFAAPLAPVATTDGTLTAGTNKGGTFGDRIRVKAVVSGAASSITSTISAYFK